METKDTKLLLVIEMLLALCLLLSNYSVYFVSPNLFPKVLRLVVPVMTGVAFLAYVIFANRYNYKLPIKKLFIISGSYAFLMTLFLGVNYFYYRFHLLHTVLFYYVIPILFIFFGGVSFSIYRAKNILRAIVRMTCLLALLSLFFWILAEVNFPVDDYLFIDWGSKHNVFGFYGLHFLAQEPAGFFGLNLIRNTGLYAEAPMFSFVLSVSFVFNLFYLQKDISYRFRNGLLLVTIFTTVSTTGILIAFLAIFGKFIGDHHKFYTNLSKRLRFLIAFFGSFTLLIGLGGILINKLNTFQGSVSIRSDDIHAGFSAFSKSPFFGNGIGNLHLIKRLMASYRLIPGGNNGFSIGILEVMVYGGILLLLFYLVPLFLAVLRKDYRDLFVMLLMLLLLSLAIVNEAPLYLFVLVFMFCKEIFGDRTSVYTSSTAVD
ncbi:hypothetical protein [Fructilactobacillus florum]|uniref:hypothetical protein n=1 Tax=Fructilactobacillus florum TaxID=640331 RepID=UPI00028D8ADA|nr:hypothetical protein [Fructilactobacillus florum]EKK21028.1 hypothetical protein B807_198 [Fructilactobacillus florum 2F]